MNTLTWLASYPKSGNTWVRMFVAAYLAGSESAQRVLLEDPHPGPLPVGEGVEARSSRRGASRSTGHGVTGLRQETDLGMAKEFSKSESLLADFASVAGKKKEELTEEDIREHRLAVQEQLAENIGQRVVKTHNARLDEEYRRLVFSRCTRAGIYVVRNPLDIVDSLADHTNKSLDDTIRLMNHTAHRLRATEVHAAQYIGTWSHHVPTWLNNRNEFPLLVLRYEDLQAAPEEHFGKLVRFLEGVYRGGTGLEAHPTEDGSWEFDADRLRRAIELTSFDALRQAEDKTGFAETSAVAKSGRFFRHGAAGRWRDVLSREQAAEVIRDHGEVMRMMGYDDSVVALLRNADSSPMTARVSAQNVHVAGELTLRSNVAAMTADENARASEELTLQSNIATEDGLAAAGLAMHAPPLSNSLPHEARGREDKKESIGRGASELDGEPELKKESEPTLRSNVATKMQNAIIAYEIYPQTDMPIEPAPISREWMDATQQRYAYRCLPLTVANQAGWVIANPTGFTARWNGGPRVEDVIVEFDNDANEKRISSLFGHGVVTFNLPYLIRTPENINLWVKGPTNAPKDGVQALEGIVESDWTSASFTMNWKLTRPNHVVRFERGEPFCMIVPFPRGLLESLVPSKLPLDSDAEVSAGYRRWSAERDAYHEQVASGDRSAIERGWQKDYFQGRDPGTDRFAQHQTKLGLRPFGGS